MKTEGGSSPRVAKIAVTFLAGLVAVMLLLPRYGLESDPPKCFSMFDYRVPCGAGLAFAFGSAVAGGVGFALSLKSRRK